MTFNQESIKPNSFTSYFETLKQNSQEIVTRESLIHQPTKICFETEEIHKNHLTNEVTLLIKKKFDQRFGSMIEQTTFDYQSGISTTEIWSSSNGAKEPLSITQKKFINLP